MANFGAVIGHVRKLLGRADDSPDGELLDRFAHHHDQDAFATMVKRYGPMVYAVCRRVLGNEHDTEDAFQATFVILARKASSLAGANALPRWLHTVALNTALDARKSSNRRLKREQQAARMPDSQSRDEAWSEIRDVLDKELGSLPSKYRSPLILCYLMSKTHEEAGQELGYSTKTVQRRLEEGRELLRKRLTRQCLALSSGVLGAVLAENASQGAVPPALLTSVAAIAGQDKTGALTTSVAALAHQGVRQMFVAKFKFAAAIIVSLLVLAVGAGVFTRQLTASDRDNPGRDAPGEKANQKAEDKGALANKDTDQTGKIAYLGNKGSLWIMDPDGGNARKLVAGSCALISPSPDGRKLTFIRGGGNNAEIYTVNIDGSNLKRLTQNEVYEGYPRWSPDGTKIAFGRRSGDGSKFEIWIMDADGTNAKKIVGPWRTGNIRISWSPDGKEIVYDSRLDNGEGGIIATTIDGARSRSLTTNKNSIDWWPEWSPDGKHIAYASSVGDVTEIWLVTADGKVKKQLTQNKLCSAFLVWSPSSSKIAFLLQKSVVDGQGPLLPQVCVIDVQTGKQTRLTTDPNVMHQPHGWSPDSKKVLFTGPGGICVLDADGRNLKVLGKGDRPVWVASTTKGQAEKPKEKSKADVPAELKGEKILAAFDIDGHSRDKARIKRQAEKTVKAIEKSGNRVVKQYSSGWYGTGMFLLEPQKKDAAKALSELPQFRGAMVFQDGNYREGIGFKHSKGILVPEDGAFLEYGSSAAARESMEEAFQKLGKTQRLVVQKAGKAAWASDQGGSTYLKLTSSAGKSLLEIFLATEAGFRLQVKPDSKTDLPASKKEYKIIAAKPSIGRHFDGVIRDERLEEESWPDTQASR